jgi:hypothetical protein
MHNEELCTLLLNITNIIITSSGTRKVTCVTSTRNLKTYTKFQCLVVQVCNARFNAKNPVFCAHSVLMCSYVMRPICMDRNTIRIYKTILRNTLRYASEDWFCGSGYLDAPRP